MGRSKKKEEPTEVPKIESLKEKKVYQPIYKGMAEEVVIKPWGSFCVLDNGPGWKTKKIQINPGLRFSLQTHAKRDEFWVVVEGTGEAIMGNVKMPRQLVPGDAIFIYKDHQHRLKCTSDTPLIIIEIQYGDCREEDICRIEDDFGRN